MKILGINISHDASSCLMVDGKVIYYIEDERFAKIKHYEYDNDLKFYGIKKLEEHNIKELDYIVFSSYRRRTTVYEDEAIINGIIKQIIKLGIKADKIYYNKQEHHLYHAYNGFYNSGFEEAAILICDGGGAYTDQDLNFREVETIYYANNNSNEFNLIYKHLSSFNSFDNLNIEAKIINNVLYSNSLSCGKVFASICRKFGFNDGADAGKVMGLSSYGNVKDDISWIDIVDGFPYINNKFVNFIRNGDLTSFEKQSNVAKKVQEETKKYTIKLIQKTIEQTQSNNIVLSGGYFMNCVNNYEYLKAFPNVNFYIDPICYDGGTSLGACYFIYKNLNLPFKPINTLYLGG
jgi:carbamoyltransferase